LVRLVAVVAAAQLQLGSSGASQPWSITAQQPTRQHRRQLLGRRPDEWYASQGINVAPAPLVKRNATQEKLDSLKRAHEELVDYLMAEVPGFRHHAAGLAAEARNASDRVNDTLTATEEEPVPCHACDLRDVLVPPEVAWVNSTNPNWVNELNGIKDPAVVW
jgi:hypothetical protein